MIIYFYPENTPLSAPLRGKKIELLFNMVQRYNEKENDAIPKNNDSNTPKRCLRIIYECFSERKTLFL